MDISEPRVPGPETAGAGAHRSTDRSPQPWAIILAGGRGTRLGGRSKAAIRVGDSTLLDRLLATVSDCRPIVVGDTAGARVPATRERPPGGGPAAGVAAGFAALGPPGNGSDRDVLVLAVDQPGITARTIRRLRAAVPADRAAGACLIAAGHRLYAASVIPARLLAARLGTRLTWHDQSLRSLLGPLLAVGVPARGDEAQDIDTIDDLRYWTDRGGETGSAGRWDDGRDGMGP